MTSPEDRGLADALAGVRARLDQAYAMKAGAEQEIKDLTVALITIGRELALGKREAEPELTGNMDLE